jgi:hypothetical protein
VVPFPSSGEKTSFGSVGKASHKLWTPIAGNLSDMRPCRFEVLTAVVMKSSAFWDTTSCSPMKFNRRFGGTCRLHFQGRRISQARNQRESRWQAEPEDGGDMFPRNVG